MRLLVSNPDTLGDLVLRQPMYRALLDAGHELTLVVRPAVAPLVRHVAPGAGVLELPYEVYADDIASRWDRFGELFDKARASNPDALVVAPYRWTAFDERLSEELPERVKRFGLSGHLYRGDPHNGEAPASRMRPFDGVAHVCEDSAEVEKNAALASLILGESDRKSLPHPRLEIGQAERDRAAQILSELGLDAGDYWVACVTGTAHVSLKAWRRENWAETLQRWAAVRGRKFLFVGLASEAADASAVREAMGEVGAAHTRVWMPPGGTIDELLGLTALSAGYVGHDTGPMHVAAALGKPVLAVFGGGHKLRFQPAVAPSVTVTMGVSCRGCQWVCSFAESHCVKAVPVDDVMAAADDLESGRVSEREARVLDPSPELQAQMIRESNRIAQERLRAASELSRQLEGVHTDWRRDVERLRGESDERGRQLESVVAEQREAIARAHGELGDQLREKESVIRRQDEQLREKDSMIREQDEHLRKKETALAAQLAELEARNDALHRTSDAAEQLRSELASAGEQNARLGAEIHARAGELVRLQADFDQKSREAAELAATIASQRGEIEQLRADLGATRDQVAKSSAESLDALKKQSDELARLREQLQAIDTRVRSMERVRPPRRPLKQVIVEAIIGPQHYYPPPPKPLPGITVVTVTHNDAATVRDTVESVIGQTHAHVQYVVVDRGSTDSTRAILDEYRDRIDKIVDEPATTSPSDALIKAYNLATYDVLGKIEAGDVFEPGGLTRVAEYFRDHPAYKAAVFGEAVSANGWRLPAAPTETPDVVRLLALGPDARPGVFVTTNGYKVLRGLTPERGLAAEWEFWLRLDRRYGIRASTAHVRTTRPRTKAASHDPTTVEAYAKARELFEASFGPLGRVRRAVLHWLNRYEDAIRRSAPPRLFYPVEFAADSRPLPAGATPARVPADQPVSPITGRMPDRLLFSTRDTIGHDDAISYVYYDKIGDVAMVYPPLDLAKLRAIYEADQRRPQKVTPPDPSRRSPYAGYRGEGKFARLLGRVRSPYWSFTRPNFGDTSVDELQNHLDGPHPRRGMEVRFLNLGCFEGGVLDELNQLTDWSLAGTETNPDAAKVARSKGHTVWESNAEDAAFVLPDDQQFDVIYLGGLLEHLENPLLVLRRLRQILAPGGRIVVDTPNLDSKLLELFGPTWSQWQAPYHRTLVGRRGLRKLARRGSFRIERLQTRTHPLAAVKSVQLNELGLGATVPDTAEFPPAVASRGVLLTGWARLLWDWRGKGDTLYAVLRAE
jgi:ADP-heptose:LPS heptosyltransferase/glycosyltransferase involved in cell wall biosynthesis/SAM-dependent methyltransferase